MKKFDIKKEFPNLSKGMVGYIERASKLAQKEGQMAKKLAVKKPKAVKSKKAKKLKTK